MWHFLALLAFGLTLIGCTGLRSKAIETIANISRPDKVEPTDARIAQLKLPPGFSIAVAETQLGDPRMLAVTPEGLVYVSQPKAETTLP